MLLSYKWISLLKAFVLSFCRHVCYLLTKVEKLKNDLKEKENIYQSMQLQLNSAKQEIERLNQKEFLISNKRQLDIFDEDEKDVWLKQRFCIIIPSEYKSE